MKLEGEDLIKRDWSHEMATYCWPLTDLYESVGETLIVEEYNIPDRAILIRAISGPNQGKVYKFTVFCLQLPNAIYLEREKFPYSNTIKERFSHFFRRIKEFAE